MVVMEQDESAGFDTTMDDFDAMLADSEPARVTGPPRETVDREDAEETAAHR
jgi:hypothetical protein